MINQNNNLEICGKLITDLEIAHEAYGEKFYDGKIAVTRLSGNTDILNITVSERLLLEHTFKVGSILNARGQFRSYNKQINGKNKLILTLFITDILEDEPTTEINKVELTGYLCKPPVYRKTPLNREIADILIAVNRSYNKSDYIPCIVWGRNAKAVSYLKVGDKINLIGRIQSREYQKKIDDTIQTLTAYEVSAYSMSILDNSEKENER